MSSDDTVSQTRTATTARPAHRLIFRLLIVSSALIVGATVGTALWYFNSAKAIELAELSPQNTWDWIALVVVGVILIAMASVLTWVTMSVIRFAHHTEADDEED